MVRVAASFLICLLCLSGCIRAQRVPQYEPKPGDKRLSPEEAAAAKAKTAADFAKGYEEAKRRSGATGDSAPTITPPGK